MRKMTTLVSLATLCIGLAAPVFADHHEKASMESASVADAMISQIEDAKSKLLEIAEATPADKYEWAPAEGIRSFAETFLHVCAANYGIPYYMGTMPPEGVDAMTLEKSTTDKAEIIKHLEVSFDHILGALEAMPAERYGEEIELFGMMKMNILGGFMMAVTHGHEHLGQSIAYARSNGIAPPWTARQNAEFEAARKKAAEKADE